MTLVDLLPFAAIAAVFWLLIIRPASARRKEQARLVASLTPGQRIMTTAGMFGTLVAREGERISLEIAPGVVIELLAQAVAQVVPADPAAQPDSDLAQPVADLEEPADPAEPTSEDAQAADLQAAPELPVAPEPQTRSELQARSEVQTRSEAGEAADRG